MVCALSVAQKRCHACAPRGVGFVECVWTAGDEQKVMDIPPVGGVEMTGRTRLKCVFVL